MKKFEFTRAAFLKGLALCVSLFVVVNLLITTKVNAGNSQSKDWSIIATYDIPGKASGLAWDGTYIYFGIYGVNGNQVHRFDPATGMNELLFTSTVLEDAFGMTWDGTNIWITDHANSSSSPAYAMKFDMGGNVISQFDLPDHYMSGIAYDNGDFWVATYYPNPGTIYKVDNTGAVLQQIPSPNTQPWDLCLQGNDIWVVDYDGNALYKIDQAGTIIETHPCENMKPLGVVFDGQYLWYVDGQLSSNSTLYKVDLYGSGTPVIVVPVTEYNYGNVSLGDSAVWYCDVYSAGTAELVITNLIIQNAVPIFVWMSFPQVIAPGNSIQIPFIYKPYDPIPLNTWIIIESNDPVNPQVQLDVTGDGVYNGPHIQVPYTNYSFGEVRMNATTRWFLPVLNDGNQTLQVTNIEFSDSHFYLDDNISFPLNINVLETAQVGIWFHPDQDDVFSVTLTIYHNDPTQGEIQVYLEGLGSDMDYAIGYQLWNFNINTGFDNSIKAIVPIADVSSDGISDVIVGSEDDFIRCFNGNASTTADILWENEAGSVYGQNDLCIIEDINNDGFEDVVAGLVWGERAVKVLSGKTGELIWIYDTHVYGGGGWVYQVSAKYDYNSDGFDDVLAATGNDGNNTGPKRIFCLNGLSGDVLWDTYTDGPNFSVIGVEDFTGDELPDAIAGASTVNETDGKVYGIDGSNGSITFEHTTSGSSVWALEQLDDITGDDVKDIIAGDFGGNYYLMNPVYGTTVNTGNVGTSLLLRFENLEDINGDGVNDIAVGHSGTNAVAINGFSGQNIWLTGLADKCWNIDKIEDITGDGINDLIAGTLYSNNYCYFLDGVNGDVLFSVNYGEAVDGICSIPDITGDGSWEMVAGGRDGKLNCYSGGLNSTIISADFIADTTFGYIPFEVNFTDLSYGPVNSWEWDFENDGIIDSYDQNPSHTYTSIGLYSVKLTAANGPNSHTMIKEDYIIADSTVNIANYSVIDNVKIIPNPFKDQISVSFNLVKDERISVEIYDTKGELVNTLMEQQYLKAGNHNLIWDGTSANNQSVQNGIYIMSLEIGNNPAYFKIVKQ